LRHLVGRLVYVPEHVERARRGEALHLLDHPARQLADRCGLVLEVVRDDGEQFALLLRRRLVALDRAVEHLLRAQQFVLCRVPDAHNLLTLSQQLLVGVQQRLELGGIHGPFRQLAPRFSRDLAFLFKDLWTHLGQ